MNKSKKGICLECANQLSLGAYKKVSTFFSGFCLLCGKNDECTSPNNFAWSEKELAVIAAFKSELAKLVIGPDEFCALELIDYHRTGYKLCVRSNIISEEECDIVEKYEKLLDTA